MTPPASASASTSPPPTGGGNSKPKRKRVSRACDQCFQKKDRCDGAHPICSFCATLNRTCTYLRPERKRGPTQGLRPRLEQRIVTLEALLGFALVNNPSLDLHRFKKLSQKEKEEVRREGWVESKVRRELGLDDDLVPSSAAGLSTATKTEASPTEENEDNEEDDSDYSEVDLSLPPTHHPPPLPTYHHHQHHNLTTAEPVLSSGKGGSSLNRGLVPRGQDPNAALGGFEIEFGGSKEDEDWVRSFVPPSYPSKSYSREREEPRNGSSHR